MKKLILDIYQVNELQKEKKENAISANCEIIVENNYWWYEHVYHDFEELMKYVGVETETFFFNGFGQQGEGSAFESEITNAYQFIKKVQNKEWIKYAPDLNINVPKLPIETKTLNMIKNGTLICEWKTKSSNRSNYLDFHTDYCLNKKDDYIDRKSNLMKEIIKLETWMENIMNQFNDYLFKMLADEYYYLITDRVVESYCIENDLFFAQNGERINQEWIEIGKVI